MEINDKGLVLQSKTHNKFHASQQVFLNLASDFMTAVLPANQTSCLKIFVNKHVLQHGDILIIHAPGIPVATYTIVDKKKGECWWN